MPKTLQEKGSINLYDLIDISWGEYKDETKTNQGTIGGFIKWINNKSMQKGNPEDNQWKLRKYSDKEIEMSKLSVVFDNTNTSKIGDDKPYRMNINPNAIFINGLSLYDFLSQQAEKQSAECLDCKAHKSVMVCIPCRNRFRDRAIEKQREELEKSEQREKTLIEMLMQRYELLRDGVLKDLTNNKDE